MPERRKYVLKDEQMPTTWVNVLPSLKEPMEPPLDPRTLTPLGPEGLQAIFPMALI